MFVASIFGIKTTKLYIKINGLNISLDDTKKLGIKWLLIYLAGPLSNLILCVCYRKIEFIYYINHALLLINMLPIYPLDGFNILEILLKNVGLKKIKRYLSIIQNVVILLLLVLGMIQIVHFHNPSIFLMVIYVHIHRKKYEDKEKTNIYQNCYKNITKF